MEFSHRFRAPSVGGLLSFRFSEVLQSSSNIRMVFENWYRLRGYVSFWWRRWRPGEDRHKARTSYVDGDHEQSFQILEYRVKHAGGVVSFDRTFKTNNFLVPWWSAIFWRPEKNQYNLHPISTFRYIINKSGFKYC